MLKQVMGWVRAAPARFARWRKDPTGWRRAHERMKNDLEADWTSIKGRLEIRFTQVANQLAEREREIELLREREVEALLAWRDFAAGLLEAQQKALASHKEAIGIHEARLNHHARTMKRMTGPEQVRFLRQQQLARGRRVVAERANGTPPQDDAEVSPLDREAVAVPVPVADAPEGTPELGFDEQPVRIGGTEA